MTPNTTTPIRRRAAAVAACLLALGLAACGDDEDTAAAADEVPTEAVDSETETETDTEADAAENGVVVEVTAKDWAFERLPVSIEAGTKLSLVNEGDEPHELVAMRIPDSETRGLNELLRLPEDELGAIFGAGEPATVILAASGTTDTPGPVVGDGTISEPGRYAIVCFLPVGADDSILESDGPPESDAPPHASQGMFAELVVT